MPAAAIKNSSGVWVDAASIVSASAVERLSRFPHTLVNTNPKEADPSVRSPGSLSIANKNMQPHP